jgi:hypothetical protein
MRHIIFYPDPRHKRLVAEGWRQKYIKFAKAKTHNGKKVFHNSNRGICEKTSEFSHAREKTTNRYSSSKLIGQANSRLLHKYRLFHSRLSSIWLATQLQNLRAPLLIISGFHSGSSVIIRLIDSLFLLFLRFPCLVQFQGNINPIRGHIGYFELSPIDNIIV